METIEQAGDKLWAACGRIGRSNENIDMSQSPQRLLSLSAGITALAAAATLAAPGGRWLPAALWHLIFAVGAMPMILSAMGYFVPVLTRGASGPRWLALAPLTALAAGLGIVGFFMHGTMALRLVAPWLALVAAAGFAAWLALRWRRCLGRPNPCLAWYAAALAMLALGLLAVALAPWLPDQVRALRLFHLHINTLGFMALTALGTLQVLLPTVAGRPDPEALARLRGDLGWSASGALLLALGAAWSAPLAVLGALAYAWPVVRLARHAWRNLRPHVLSSGNTMPLLGAALAGLALALAHGLVHGFGFAAGADAVALFVVGFLVPLVSGAAGHLLPVWLRPGMQDQWHRDSRRTLAFGARARAALLLLGGILAAAGATAGYLLGALGGLWLVAAMLRVTLSR